MSVSRSETLMNLWPWTLFLEKKNAVKNTILKTMEKETCCK